MKCRGGVSPPGIVDLTEVLRQKLCDIVGGETPLLQGK
jgi:hypothetical protein